MYYQIIVISEMHNDANRNAVKGSRPLNIDSLDVTNVPSKLWSAHRCSLQKCFCTYFLNVISNSDEFK